MKIADPKFKSLGAIIPISLTGSSEKTKETILTLKKEYGFSTFALIFPSKGWRGHSYPPTEHYVEYAKVFREIKEDLKTHKIICGWWVTATLKAGPDKVLEPIIRPDGTSHPFAFCPLGENFGKRIAKNTALFAKYAEPEFILFEDDYSIKAANGCFCDNHVNEFSKRMGKNFSREELVEIFSRKSPESYDLIKKWRELLKDSLTDLATKVRKELDIESPHIPIGLCQPGGVDYDGDATESIARAMAGPNHTPYVRLYGTFYCGVDAKKIPEELYHPLYTKQRLGDDFICHHESDSYPHSRFFTSGKHMKSIMATAYSFGCDGSLFQVVNSEDPHEETAYSSMYQKEYQRFDAIHRIAKKSEIKGVEITYDPFWNTVDESCSTTNPLWAECISRFGIPITTIEAAITFWDVRQAKYASDETIMKNLSKVLFLDGDAAKALTDRGYGKYIGVTIGENLAEKNNLQFDLGCWEIICENFARKDKVNIMPPAHCYAPSGNGIARILSVADEKCEVISENFSTKGDLLCPAMTKFKNELGGEVVVMGLTLDGNRSQALLNYPRQRLFQDLIKNCSDCVVFAKNAPDISVIMNEAKSGVSDFIGMVTLINLCEDDLPCIHLHLPPSWKEAKDFLILNKSGEWESVSYECEDDEIRIDAELRFCEPVYILAK